MKLSGESRYNFGATVAQFVQYKYIYLISQHNIYKSKHYFTMLQEYYFNTINTPERMDDNKQQLSKIIQNLLCQYVPNYQPGKIQITPLCGTTNETFRAKLQQGRSIVFKILSPIIDRELEGQIVNELSKLGISPRCYFTSVNYRIEEFVQNARHPDPQQIAQNQNVLKAIMDKVNGFHQLEFSNNQIKQNVSEKMFSLQKRIKYQQAKPHQTYNILQYEQFKFNTLKQFEEMKEWLNKNFGLQEQKIRFCHNDLNNANIFIKDISQQQKSCILIDFDYVGYNYIAYDLANLLNQTCFTYGGNYPGFKVSKRVTKDMIKKVCNLYKFKYEGLEADIYKMLALVNYYWALWSIIIKPTQSSPNFCPLKHGIARFQLVHYYRSQQLN